MENPPDSTLSDSQFNSWLLSVQERFKTLSPDQKNTTLTAILQQSSSEQLCYLVQAYLPSACQRDFFRYLPVECSHHVLKYLDGDTVVNCCLISKSWYQVVSCCKQLWIRLLMEAGEKHPTDLSLSAQTFKQKYMRRRYLNHRLKQGKLYETLSINKPAGTRKISALKYKHPLIMIVADGKQVFTMNATTERYDDISYKITNEVNSISYASLDDQYLYIGQYNGQAVSWRLYTDQPYCYYIGHVNAIFGMSANREKNLLLTIAADVLIKLWDFNTGIVLKSFNTESKISTSIEFLNVNGDNIIPFLSFSKHNYQVTAWTATKIDKSGSDIFVINLVNRWHGVKSLNIADDGTFHIQKMSECGDKNSMVIFQYKMDVNTQNDIEFKCCKQFFLKGQCDLDYKVIGIGERFALILELLHGKEAWFLLLHNLASPLDSAYYLPVRCYGTGTDISKLITVCEKNWLNGFDNTNQSGFIHASIFEDMEDGSQLYACRWLHL